MDTSLKQQLKDSGYKGEFDLSSLVDACGYNFRSLHHKKKGWKVYYLKGITKGKTPEEAVAKLYIELNKTK